MDDDLVRLKDFARLVHGMRQLQRHGIKSMGETTREEFERDVDTKVGRILAEPVTEHQWQQPSVDPRC